MSLYTQNAEFVAYLEEWLDGRALELILARDEAALAGWLGSVDENGRFDLPAKYCRLRKPLTATFPELAES